MIRRFVLVLIVAAAALTAAVVTPAWACGCGAYAPEHGGAARVPMETALVRVNADATEDVYLSLSVNSTVRTAALLFPVPDKTAVVSSGPRDLFSELARMTDPPGDLHAPGNDGQKGGAPNPAVTVEKRQQLGPLDVVTLSSGDPAALTRWLQTNGFSAKPALADAAKPYTDTGWAFVAVRLRPGAPTTARLDGTLDPLHIHFASKDVVYPMRLSAMGSEPERVRVYTLAAHRLDLKSSNPGMTITWADQVEVYLRGAPELRRVALPGATYLTRFDGRLDPRSITDDFHFSRANSDAAHRTRVVERQPEGSTGSGGDTARDVLLGVLTVVLLLAVAGALARWQKSRQP